VPLYIYECDACKGTYELRHSIKEDPERCKECEVEGALRRIPAMPIIIKKEKGTPTKAGELVKKFIEEARRDLKKEKEENKRREYEQCPGN